MISPADHVWRPTIVERAVKALTSNMGTVEVVTDKGAGYLKPLGGCNAGPHPLACEWVGSNLARWFGLPLPSFAIIEVDDIAVDMINELPNGKSETGPAFISQKIDLANPWDGTAKTLEKIENTNIIPKLVLFDMFTLNWDRCPPPNDPNHKKENQDNLLIVGDKTGKRKNRLIPIDFGECYSINRELNGSLANIDRIKDGRLFGLFEAFKSYITLDLIENATEQLGQIEESFVFEIIDKIPEEWQVDVQARRSLAELICRRAAFLAENGKEILRYSNGELF